MKVLDTFIQCKSLQNILHIFNCYSKHFIKNNLKHLTFVILNNIFLEQILQKLISVRSLLNLFSELENCFLFQGTETCFQEQFLNRVLLSNRYSKVFVIILK